jgi:hypothetical protein
MPAKTKSKKSEFQKSQPKKSEPKKSATKKSPPKPGEPLKGWQQIAAFLGQPVSVAQRWAKSGMPVSREGRQILATPQELNTWLGRESAGEPVQIATEDTDLGSELKRGLSYVRKHSRD